MVEIENLKNLLCKIPSINSKGAYKIVYSLLESDPQLLDKIISSMVDLKNLKKCKKCYNYSKSDLCPICLDSTREKTILCVIESQLDIELFEGSGFTGVYHVLGGLLSPINGINVENLNLENFYDRIKNEGIKEVIFALKPTTEGDTTTIYLKNELQSHNLGVIIKKLPLGVQMGKGINSIDRLTLKEALNKRVDI